MKPLKEFFICLLAISFIPHTSSADDGNTLYYYSKSSTTPIKVSLDDLDKITFDINGIELWQQSGMNKILFEDFFLFTFKEIEHPNITEVEQSLMPQDLRIRFFSNQRTLLIESRQPINDVSVYDLIGRMLTSETIDDTNSRIILPHSNTGIYFVKVVRDGKVFVKKIVL